MSTHTGGYYLLLQRESLKFKNSLFKLITGLLHITLKLQLESKAIYYYSVGLLEVTGTGVLRPWTANSDNYKIF